MMKSLAIIRRMFSSISLPLAGIEETMKDLVQKQQDVLRLIDEVEFFTFLPSIRKWLDKLNLPTKCLDDNGRFSNLQTEVYSRHPYFACCRQYFFRQDFINQCSAGRRDSSSFLQLQHNCSL
eukprot:m.218390 g.218390  ORF g.218390 m.218390 type:complete len:122 (+) comp39895_c2_seq15:922-1287(+)